MGIVGLMKARLAAAATARTTLATAVAAAVLAAGTLAAQPLQAQTTLRAVIPGPRRRAARRWPA